MKFPILFALCAALSAATPPARAEEVSPADQKYLKDFVAAIEDNDVEVVKQLIAAPGFSPTLVSLQHDTLFEEAVSHNKPEISRLMMQSPAWKSAKWEDDDARNILKTTAREKQLFPIL